MAKNEPNKPDEVNIVPENEASAQKQTAAAKEVDKPLEEIGQKNKPKASGHFNLKKSNFSLFIAMVGFIAAFSSTR